MKRFLLIATVVLLAGCDGRALLQKFLPKDDDAFARRFFSAVQAGDFPAATGMLEENLRATASANLTQMRSVLDHGAPLSFEPISFLKGVSKVTNQPAKEQCELTYQIQFSDSWALANVVVDHAADGLHISGAHVQPITDSLGKLNAFRFQGKSVLHYLVLAVCIFIPLFIFYTIVVCFRARPRFRWLWIIFMLFGFGQFQFNWTNGDWIFQPFSFLLFGAAVMRNGLYGPWILQAAFPVAAILFLVLRRRLQGRVEPVRDVQ